jgi:membrane protease YdiL (CAAX protease family)
MTEPNNNEPPLVTRPDPGAPEPPLVTRPEDEATSPSAPKRPRPAFWEAVLWCVVFVMAQALGLILAVIVAFTAHALSAENPKQFVKEQLDGVNKAVDTTAQGDRPPVPAAFGESLAWGALAAPVTSLALILLVFPRRIGPDWKRQLGVRRPYWLHVGLVLLIGPGFMLLADIIQSLFTWATGIAPPTMKALNDVFRTFPWPLTLLAVSIGPGVVEELWCRGFLGRGLSARYGIVVGVLTTSVFFAAMHLNPAQLFVYVLMGAYLHFVYLATRSIWPPILLHALNNGMGIVLMLALTPEKLDRPMPLVVPLAALSLVIFGTVALWTSRAKLEPILGYDPKWWDAAEWQSDWKPEYPGISVPPPGADARLGHAMASPVALIFSGVSFAALMYLAYRYLI